MTTKTKTSEAEAKDILRSQFDANFSEWFHLRAAEFEDETEEQQNARGDRQDDLAQLIFTSPVTSQWMVFRKLEVINYFITKHGEVETWGALLAAAALASIKTDILRIDFMRDSGWGRTAFDRMGDAKARQEAFLKYEANYKEWLRVRSETDEQAPEPSGREQDLTHFLLTAPAVREGMVFRKLEVIEHYLMKYGDRSYVETTALEALANIKLDLLRCGLMREAWFERPLAIETEVPQAWPDETPEQMEAGALAE